MVDWDYLQNNMTQINFSSITNSVSDPKLVTQALIDNADTASSGYLGLGIMTITFIVFIIMLFRDDGDIKMDIARTIMLSSGFTFILGLIGLVLNIFSSFVHVMWYFVIFLLSLLSVLVLKKKGL